jgi:hypothetical protein
MPSCFRGVTATVVAAVDLLFIVVALPLSTVVLQIVAAAFITDHPVVGAVNIGIRHSMLPSFLLLSLSLSPTLPLWLPLNAKEAHREIWECHPSILDRPLLSVREA